MQCFIYIYIYIYIYEKKIKKNYYGMRNCELMSTTVPVFEVLEEMSKNLKGKDITQHRILIGGGRLLTVDSKQLTATSISECLS